MLMGAAIRLNTSHGRGVLRYESAEACRVLHLVMRYESAEAYRVVNYNVDPQTVEADKPADL